MAGYLTPARARFYIDLVQYANAAGMVKSYHESYGLDPYTEKEVPANNAHTVIFNDYTLIPCMEYIAVLGHKLFTPAASQGYFTAYGYSQGAGSVYITGAEYVGLTYNANSYANVATADGYGIVKNSTGLMPPTGGYGEADNHLDKFIVKFFNMTDPLGCISLGWYYDMTIAPEINNMVGFESGGVDVSRTPGGSYLTNSYWDEPPGWAGREQVPWYLAPTADVWYTNNKGAGARVWELSYTFMAETDLKSQYHTEGFVPFELMADLDANIAGDQSHVVGIKDTFYDKVWRGTMAGRLPFIFQPDIADDKTYAVARFDQNSIKFTQDSPNTYSFSCRIVESW